MAYGQDKTGRIDAALGSVSIVGLRGEALSNAKMKAETKAKRRATLSICGLGFVLDETEIETVPAEAKQKRYKTLPKREAKPLFAALQAEMYQQATRGAADTWFASHDYYLAAIKQAFDKVVGVWVRVREYVGKLDFLHRSRIAC